MNERVRQECFTQSKGNMDASKKSREEGFTKRLEAFKLKMKRLYVFLLR